MTFYNKITREDLIIIDIDNQIRSSEYIIEKRFFDFGKWCVFKTIDNYKLGVKIDENAQEAKLGFAR